MPAETFGQRLREGEPFTVGTARVEPIRACVRCEKKVFITDGEGVCLPCVDAELLGRKGSEVGR